LTWIFNAQNATTNKAAIRISAIIACLCCVTFVDGFPVAALPDCYQDVVLFSRREFIRGIWLMLCEAF